MPYVYLREGGLISQWEGGGREEGREAYPRQQTDQTEQFYLAEAAAAVQ